MSLAAGAANVGLWPLFLLPGPSTLSDTLTGAFFVNFGLILVAQGAAGLIRNDRPCFSRWLWVLHALLGLPLIALISALVYAWTGWEGVFVVLVFVAKLIVGLREAGRAAERRE
jgi:hypothetical protein